MKAATQRTRWNWSGILKVSLGTVFWIGFIYLLVKYPLPHKGDIDPDILAVFSEICSSEVGKEKGVEQAAIFAGGRSGLVPTLLLRTSGGLYPYKTEKGLGPYWDPKSASDVQLVVCVSDETELTFYCDGGKYEGTWLGRTAVVREARTGVALQSYKLSPAYTCPSGRKFPETYSVEAIRKLLAQELATGSINARTDRYFTATDIQADATGRRTYIRIELHRLESGQMLQFHGVCSVNEAQLLRGLKDQQVYHAVAVDEDTLQLTLAENGDPIEITDMAECGGYLSSDVPGE